MLAVHFILHNDFSDIHGALASLRATTHTPVSLHITINSGTPEATAALQAAYPQVAVYINATPQGFAANHNAFMRRVDAPYYALLNDDITLHPGTLDTLVTYLADHPQAGLVAPIGLNPDGSPQITVFSDPSLLRALYTISGFSRLTRHGGFVRKLVQRSGLARLIGTESLQVQNHTRAVPVLSGVAMIVRQAAFKQVGGMDEPTRVYGEEYGWHRRLRAAGWQVVLVAEATLTHHNPANDLTGWRITEQRKSILAYFLKYQPRWQAAIIRAAIVFSHTGWALAYAPFQRSRMYDHWRTVRMALTWQYPPTVAQAPEAAG